MDGFAHQSNVYKMITFDRSISTYQYVNSHVKRKFNPEWTGSPVNLMRAAVPSIQDNTVTLGKSLG